MATPNYSAVLELFTCKDITRKEWSLKPFRIEGNVYATDFYCMVWFDEKLIPSAQEIIIHDNPKVLSVIPIGSNIRKQITIDDIKTAISHCPTEKDFDWVGEDIVCKECNGDGDVVWEYNEYQKEFECPKCDGEGLTSKRRQKYNGKQVVTDASLIKIKRSYFSAKFLQRIIDLAELLNESSVTLVNQPTPDKANLFEMGNVSLLIMPVGLLNAEEDLQWEIK